MHSLELHSQCLYVFVSPTQASLKIGYPWVALAIRCFIQFPIPIPIELYRTGEKQHCSASVCRPYDIRGLNWPTPLQLEWHPKVTCRKLPRRVLNAGLTCIVSSKNWWEKEWVFDHNPYNQRVSPSISQYYPIIIPLQVLQWIIPSLANRNSKDDIATLWPIGSTILSLAYHHIWYLHSFPWLKMNPPTSHEPARRCTIKVRVWNTDSWVIPLLAHLFASCSILNVPSLPIFASSILPFPNGWFGNSK